MSTAIPDLDALKQRMRATWMSGDFGEIAHVVEDLEKEFVERLGITPGMKVLDVACGTGNSAIPAAKLGADVTGIDIAPNLIEQAKARAEAEGVAARFEEGDAEALPYPDRSFDLVISIFGAMFAPRPDVAASEMLRVCRPGGSIAMGNWTPAGFSGQMFKLATRFAPPPPGVPAPVLWGDPDTVRARFGNRVSDLRMTPRPATMKYPFDEAATVEHFIKYFGPTIRTYQALDPAGQSEYRRETENLYRKHNQAKDGTLRIESEFLEVLATRA